VIRLAAILALVLAQITLAVAAGVPRFNIKATCRQAQPLAGSGDKNVYQGCVVSEVEARKQLAKLWRSFKDSSRRSCVGETQIGGVPSYVDLLSCLQLDKEAGSLPQ
jgi:hypothetical protein